MGSSLYNVKSYHDNDVLLSCGVMPEKNQCAMFNCLSMDIAVRLKLVFYRDLVDTLRKL